MAQRPTQIQAPIRYLVFAVHAHALRHAKLTRAVCPRAPICWRERQWVAVDLQCIRTVVPPVVAVVARHEQHLSDALVAKEQKARRARGCNVLDQHSLDHIHNGAGLTVLVRREHIWL